MNQASRAVRLVHGFYRWRLPSTVKDGRRNFFRPVQSHHKQEIAVRRRKPVRPLTRVRRFFLDVQTKGTILVILQRIAPTKRVTIDGVADKYRLAT